MNKDSKCRLCAFYILETVFVSNLFPISEDRLQSLGLQTRKTIRPGLSLSLCISISVSDLIHLNGVSSQDLHDSLTDS